MMRDGTTQSPIPYLERLKVQLKFESGGNYLRSSLWGLERGWSRGQWGTLTEVELREKKERQVTRFV